MTPQEAERAGEHYLLANGCVRTVRVVRTRRRGRQDLFGADVLGLTRDGHLWAAQVTKGKGGDLTRRQAKLEAVPWPRAATVVLLQACLAPPELQYAPEGVGFTSTRTSRPVWCFRVRMRAADGWWKTALVPIPPAWRKAWKEKP